MKRKLLFVLLLLLTSFCVTSYAHPGKVDSNGGHYNNTTDEYHYHHGYPAHSHVGGCPYDYDDNTGQNSGSNSNNSYNNKNNHLYNSVTESTTDKQQAENDSVLITILKIIGLAFCFVVLGVSHFVCIGLYALYYFMTNTKKNEEDQKKDSKLFNILSLFIVPIIIATIVVLCF